MVSVQQNQQVSKGTSHGRETRLAVSRAMLKTFAFAGDGTVGEKKFSLNVHDTMEALLRQEDLNQDGLITVDDDGPKVRWAHYSLLMMPLTICLQSFLIHEVHSTSGEGTMIKGTYPLAVLLQELFFSKTRGEKYLETSSTKLQEDPVHRLERLIRHTFWDTLTRQMDAKGIAAAAPDPKTADSQPRIYVPARAPHQYDYYSKLAAEKPEMHLDVQWLPAGEVDGKFIQSINSKPGILAMAMEESKLGEEMKALPFIVPGGRFNELYNWDSVFAAGWGMLETHAHISSAVIRHFIFEIEHYGKILNANRSYYLGRAQPPFLTSLALKTYEATKGSPGSKELLRDAILAAIKEYRQYWMSPPRYDEETGLSRYRPIGLGFPPECESTQFDHILAPFAKKYDMDIAGVAEAYNRGDIIEPELDIFTLHDRAVRESGHDVSMRTEGVCADLGTVDLNCLLYKYETDVAYAIREVFSDKLELSGSSSGENQDSGVAESAASWEQAAAKRKHLIDKYLWNDEQGLYFDYNTRTKQQTSFESVTAFWALWCGVASPDQAAKLVRKSLPKFEQIGGLTVGTEKSRGPIDEAHPQKQWDFPYGWPPHQILAWDGLKRYGYDKEAERLVYRWLHMIVKVFVDYNGIVVEKYNVTQLERPHRVEAEYGNQGLNFKYAPQEGYVHFR